MNFIKKLTLGSTAILTTISLVACSNNSGSSSNTNSNESAKLTLWVDTDQVSYYKKIASDFTKKHKNISVRVDRKSVV